MSDGSPIPRLLFLCQTLPYPPDSGVHNRSYNILKQLAGSFDVRSLCFFRRGTRGTADAVREGVSGLRRLGPADAFPIPQEHSRWRLVRDHALSVLTSRVYTRYAHESAPFERRLRAVLEQESFDVVHVDSLDLSGYLPALSGLPVACTHHNCEYELLERMAAAERNPLKRRVLRFQARRSREEVERWAPRVALNVVVSERDREQLQELAPDAHFMVVENGVDTEYFSPDGPDPPGGSESVLVFVGGATWFPNRDALDFFGSRILPRIRARAGNVRVLWVGHADDASRAGFREQYGVELTGYVSDIRPRVRRASCYVAPLRVGGGTRLKILDAWALGAPVVSTSIGCEGLETRPGENILVADDPAEFADAVLAVVEDPALGRRLGEGGRETAVRRYDWNVVTKPLVERYLQLAGASRGRSSSLTTTRSFPPDVRGS